MGKKSLSEGDKAPDFSMPDEDGKMVKLKKIFPKVKVNGHWQEVLEALA